jgi:D-serine deaminase-like pyridoxal phosphate-dependent protein
MAPDVELDTPAAVVDLGRVRANLARWQAECDRLGLANRPHVKTHKTVEIARMAVELGASGLTCQKLGEAEVMADAGFDDLLVSFPVVGGGKLGRLTSLLARANVRTIVDDATLLPGLDSAASAAGKALGVLVDCDTGLGRTGVGSPADAVELAGVVDGYPALRFDGFLTYPSPPGAAAFLGEAVAQAGARGLEPAVVSVGGTPSMWEADQIVPPATEYRVGTYVFHDRNTVAAGAATLDDVALTIAATVVSRPAPDRALLDAGSKALSYDRGPDDGYGLVLEAPGSAIVNLNEEHAYVTLGPEDVLEVGRQVRIVPNHVCAAVNLYDELVVVENGRVAGSWKVAARGRSR